MVLSEKELNEQRIAEGLQTAQQRISQAINEISHLNYNRPVGALDAHELTELKDLFKACFEELEQEIRS